MVYIAYFTELILQICDYAQKWRICRENCKYAFDENFHGHFCPRRKAAKFCHPAPSQSWTGGIWSRRTSPLWAKESGSMSAGSGLMGSQGTRGLALSANQGTTEGAFVCFSNCFGICLRKHAGPIKEGGPEQDKFGFPSIFWSKVFRRQKIKIINRMFFSPDKAMLFVVIILFVPDCFFWFSFELGVGSSGGRFISWTKFTLENFIS